MSSETSDSERSGLVNGIGHESPGIGVSGTKPLVNGDLRDGEKEDEFAAGTAGSTEAATDSLAATAKPVDIVTKVS